MALTELKDLASTFELLMARASTKGDIPGFSQSARTILSALSDSDEADDFTLVQTVLTDAALTQKVLRLANSAMYAVFGGEVNTVSRAIQVLGMQTVAHLALGLKVIETIDNSRPDNQATMAEMQKAVMAGYLGRQLAGDASLKDAEAAAVCSILHNLGRMLVVFYLPEHWAELKRREEGGLTEAVASQQVFGTSLEAVGQRMAEHWGLPASLTDTLRASEPQDDGPPATHEDWLSLLATASTRGARILHEETANADQALSALVTSFSGPLGLEPEKMLGAIHTAHKAVQEHFAEDSGAKTGASERERQTALLRGIKELREAGRTASLTQLISEAVEFLHITLGSRRSFAFLRFHKDKRFKARFGLGHNADALLPSLNFDDRFQPDVFHAVLAKEKALFIENAKADNLKGKLPVWWLQNLGNACSFCVVPMSMSGAPIGFVYLDWVPPQEAPKMDSTVLQVLGEVREILMTRMQKSTATA